MWCSEPVSESGRLQSQSSSSLGEEAGEQQSGLAATRNIVRSASAEDPAQQGALTTKFKRERFLKRQQCQEAAEESEVSSPASTSLPIATPVTTAPPPTPAVVLSEPLVSPAEKKVEQGEDAELEPKEEPAETGGGGGRRQLSLEPGQPATPRQPSLDPLCGLESVPLLYSSSGPRPPTSNLFRPVLPTVRITPDQEGELEPALAPSPLYPAHSPGLLHPDTGPGTWDCGPRPPPVHLEISAPPYHAPHPSYPPYCGPDTGYGRATLSQPRQFEPSRPELQTKPAAGQFGHCPKVSRVRPAQSAEPWRLPSQARDGPALSCNFCWNTTDGSGRILRRKTKYHCPECQTNLCIGRLPTGNNYVLHRNFSLFGMLVGGLDGVSAALCCSALLPTISRGNGEREYGDALVAAQTKCYQSLLNVLCLFRGNKRFISMLILFPKFKAGYTG